MVDLIPVKYGDSAQVHDFLSFSITRLRLCILSCQRTLPRGKKNASSCEARTQDLQVKSLLVFKESNASV